MKNKKTNKTGEIKTKIKERFSDIDTTKSSAIKKPKSGKGI